MIFLTRINFLFQFFRQDYCRYKYDFLDNLEHSNDIEICQRACQINPSCNFITFSKDEKVGFSPDEIAEKMEDLIKPKVDQNGAILDPQVPPKYEEIVDELQKENSDKSSDTVVLADIHVSE